MKVKDKIKKECKIHSIILMLPLIIGLVLFKLWPLLQIVTVSFKENYNSLSGKYSGIGMGNYIEIFKDEYFLQSIDNTFVYMCIVSFCTVIIGFLVAWSLYRVSKFSGIFIVLILLPLITSDVVMGICWRYMFNDKGIVNALLRVANIKEVPWLTDLKYSFVSLVLFGIWTSLSMTVLLFYSAMQRINSNIIIAAFIDRSSEKKILKRIVLPKLSSTIQLVTVINLISSGLVFNGLFALYSGAPGPYYNIYTAVYYIYAKAGEGAREFGIACAASVILLVSVLILLIIRCMFYGKKE